MACWRLLSSNCSELCAFRCVSSLSVSMDWMYPRCWSTGSAGICLQSWSFSLFGSLGLVLRLGEGEQNDLGTFGKLTTVFGSIRQEGNYFPFLKMSPLLLEEWGRSPFIKQLRSTGKCCRVPAVLLIEDGGSALKLFCTQTKCWVTLVNLAWQGRRHPAAENVTRAGC